MTPQPLPVVTMTTETPSIEHDLSHRADTHQDLPTPAQERAADGVFTATTEQGQVAALLGMWTGALMLHDLAVEALETPAAEGEEEKKKAEK